MSITNLFTKIKSQPFVKDLALLLTDRCVQLLGQLFNIFILTKYLGPSNFGILMYSLSVYGFLLSISNVGMDRVLVVELARAEHNNQKSNLILSSIFIKLTTSIGILSILYFGYSLINSILSKDVYTVLTFICLGLLFSIWQIVDAYNQSIGMFKNTAFARIITVVAAVVAKSIFIYVHSRFIAIVWVFALEQFFCLLLCLFMSPRFNMQVLSIKLKGFKFQKELLKSGMFVMVSTACIIIYFRTSQVIIENRFDKVYLGLFSLVIYLVEMPVSLASIMSTLFTPKLAISYSNKADRNVGLEYARVLLIFLLVSLFSIGILVTVGGMLSSLLGIDYKGFYSMLLQSLIAIPLIFTGYFAYMIMLSGKKFKQYLVVTLLGGIGALLYLYFARNYYTKSNAVYLYVLSQFIASFLIPIIMQHELRIAIIQIGRFIIDASVFKQLKAVNNMFK